MAASIATPPQLLEETQIISGFHLLLKHALAHASAEGLLEEAELQHGAADVQVSGPALTLYFAALLSRGKPPSIVAPDGSFVLSSRTCPASFARFFALWQKTVPLIQALPADDRHDLALLLCDKEPRASPLRADVARIAADIKTVAIDIAQRRTFAQRFADDLQHALDSAASSGANSRSSGESARTEFRPPPEYDFNDQQQYAVNVKVPVSEGSASTSGPAILDAPPVLPPQRVLSQGPSSSSSSAMRLSPPYASAAFAAASMEQVSLIRETVFSALADAIVTTPSLGALLRGGSSSSWETSRALFAALCIAIYEVALTRTSTQGVRVVMAGPQSLSMIRPESCPPPLRPLLDMLLSLHERLSALADADNAQAIEDAAAEMTPPPRSTTRMERLRARLENGGLRSSEADYETDDQDDIGDASDDGAGGPASISSSAYLSIASLSNSINELAIDMFEIPNFSQRLAQALRVLASVQSL